MDPENPPASWRMRCDCAPCAMWRDEQRLGIHSPQFPGWPCHTLQERCLRAAVVNALFLLGVAAFAALILSEVLR